jgi:2'-5' RNA ligase
VDRSFSGDDVSKLVIVAIPEKDDYVWKISSEKVPHLTILFLGEATETSPISKIQEFVEHAASTMLQPFWLEVSDRDILGDDQADVVFFEDAWELPRVRSFRNALLKDSNIKSAYDSVEQFPEWQPHLTLGYPETPAKEDDRDYPGIHSVRFDRIALWTGDSEGPEFKLKRPKFYDDAMEVAMSTDGKTAVENILSHYGVKGMKWGVRRDRQGRDRFSPSGHSLEGDVARAALIPAPLNLPAQIRLAKRGHAAVTRMMAEKGTTPVTDLKEKR